MAIAMGEPLPVARWLALPLSILRQTSSLGIAISHTARLLSSCPTSKAVVIISWLTNWGGSTRRCELGSGHAGITESYNSLIVGVFATRQQQSISGAGNLCSIAKYRGFRPFPNQIDDPDRVSYQGQVSHTDTRVCVHSFATSYIPTISGYSISRRSGAHIASRNKVQINLE